MTAPKRRILTEDAAKAAALCAVSDVIFWEKTRVEGECLVYTGHRDRQGYGKVGRKGMVPALAHRYAWRLVNGEIPPNGVIRHTCDNPPCVLPAHLRLGSQADNIADREAKGRGNPGRLFGEDHPGHKLSAAQVLEMRRRWRAGISIAQLAREYPVQYGTIQQILHGKLWPLLPLDGIEDAA